MSKTSSINILIAEDNDISREMMASVLKTQGFEVFGAIDGDSAIEVISREKIDLALVDINMAPKGGFEFVRYLIVKGIDLPVVVVTGDRSSDILLAASSLDVIQVLHKPIDPKRLIHTVSRILKKRGFNPDALAARTYESAYAPEELMKKAVELAAVNITAANGGPYAALVADGSGKIMGRGTNGFASRYDPVAHAEVMAIRQACEVIAKPDLSGYVLYCSSEPTDVGKALIRSVSISKVYFSLTREEVSILREQGHDRAQHAAPPEPLYERLESEEMVSLFQQWAREYQ